jgi:hypothetical protein
VTAQQICATKALKPEGSTLAAFQYYKTEQSSSNAITILALARFEAFRRADDVQGF